MQQIIEKILGGQLPFQKFVEKFTAAAIYALLSAVAMNFFFLPGHVYASGVSGLSQIVSTLIKNLTGQNVLPVSLSLFLINVPLMILAWIRLGRRFTLYTVLTVVMSSLAIRFMPVVELSRDPIINSVFGGALMGLGIGNVFRNSISSGGTDIISLYVRKRTGRNVGVISTAFNAIVVLLAGLLFGWQYLFYSLLTIFVSGRVTDAIFSKQKKMQVTIITKTPDQVKKAIFDKLKRGVTVMKGAEGGYSSNQLTILITVITGFEYPDFKDLIDETDPQAFVTITQNVKILGNFDEESK